jgi:hypothetical protein
MSEPVSQTTLRDGKPVKVIADVLDHEDGEAGITEVYRGLVLARFRNIQSAAQTLRHQRAKYEAMALERINARS